MRRRFSTKRQTSRRRGWSRRLTRFAPQVELQTRQQQLIVARNDLAKLKFSVARVIGLAPGQEFVLTEKAPYQSMTPMPLETYLQHAYTSRADYQAAASHVRVAELSRRGAFGGTLSND